MTLYCCASREMAHVLFRMIPGSVNDSAVCAFRVNGFAEQWPTGVNLDFREHTRLCTQQ